MIDMTSRDERSAKIAEEFVGYTAYNSDGELFRVIDYEMVYNPKEKRRHTLYLVQFAETGYEDLYRKQSILNGGCRDPYYPIILGVAYLGQASTVDSPFNCSKEYILWHSMITRCYNIKDKSYKTYGGAGVKVCKRWLCYEYFLKDIPLVENYQLWKNNPGLYQFDKDLKQQNVPTHMKVYSLETCMFVLRQINSIEASSRQYSDKQLPVGIKLSKAGNYMSLYGKHNLGTFTNLDAAISQRNDYIMNTASIPNEIIQPCNYIPREERKQYKVIYPKLICRIMGDDRSDEFLAKIEEQMNKNDNE